MDATDARAKRRAELAARVADHLIARGLGASSLRELAASAGTSDRMLLHYFVDKAELLGAALAVAAQRFAQRLDALALPPAEPQRLAAALAQAMAEPSMRPLGALWLELAAAAAREPDAGGPWRTLGDAIVARFHGWVEARLVVDGDAARNDAAAFVLTLFDGWLPLQALGQQARLDAAARHAGFTPR